MEEIIKYKKNKVILIADIYRFNRPPHFLIFHLTLLTHPIPDPPRCLYLLHALFFNPDPLSLLTRKP